MAEFQEVMNQWKRMCSTYDKCVQCPLKHCISPSKSNWNMSFDAERIIRDWAAEHPEPVYPTWSEWLVEIGVFPKMMSTIPSKALNAISNGVCKPIPADIAEKLGIEPKEV